MSHLAQTLQIGMIGHPALLRCNLAQFQHLQNWHPHDTPMRLSISPVFQSVDIAKLDGLLISGWQYQNIYHRLYPLQKTILSRKEHLSLWGISAGAAMLGQNGLLPVMDYTAAVQERNRLHSSILELPDCSGNRFIGTFISDVLFASPAPNLGVLCQNHSRGAIAIRQGNHLACSFAAEFTHSCYLYPYWLKMIASLKESQI